MTIDHGFLDAAVRITTAGDLIGTGFLMTVPSERHEDVRWGYVVTAHHVIAHQIETEVHAPNPAAPGELYDPVMIAGWVQPLPSVDIAVTPWALEGRVHPALPVELTIPTDVVASMRLGSTIHYIGIFEPLMRPIVRSGSVAALDQEGIPHEDYEQPLHLVDCRSYKGFSGSPCLVEFSLARLEPLAVLPWGTASAELWSGGEAVPPLGGISSFSLLCGMFARHYDYEEETRGDGIHSRYGVGVMTRSHEIQLALMSPELREQRRQWDQAS